MPTDFVKILTITIGGDTSSFELLVRAVDDGAMIRNFDGTWGDVIPVNRLQSEAMKVIRDKVSLVESQFEELQRQRRPTAHDGDVESALSSLSMQGVSNDSSVSLTDS